MRACPTLGLALLATTGLITTPAAAAAPAPKVAVVDIQRVLEEVPEGKKAKKELTKLRDSRQKEVDRRKAELQALKEQFDSQGLLLNEQKRREMEGQLQGKLLELQKLVVEHERQVQQQNLQLMQRVIPAVQAMVQQIAKEEGFTLVLVNTGQNILYFDPKYDITNQVLRRYERSRSKKK